MEKENFILELPLKVEKWQEDLLNKRYEYLRQIYNYAQGKLLKEYNYLSQMADFKNCKTKKAKSEFFNTHPFIIKGFKKPVIFSKMKSKEIDADVYGITGFIEKIAQKKVDSQKTYKDFGINTTMINALANHIWAAWEKVIYGNGKHISFKKYGDINTISIRKKGNFNGLDVDINNMFLAFNINGKIRSNSKKIKLLIDYKKLTDYEIYSLKNGYDSIRVVTIARKLIRGKYKYYVQFTIEGEKPQKGRTLGKGNVGIDVGPSTIAVSSLKGVSIDTLSEKCDDIEHDLYIINRKMDRSLRATNHQNFKEDGQIKPINRREGQKRHWNKSKHYVNLSNKKRELLRKQAAIRKLQHNIKANELLTLGNTFIVENNPISAWVKKSKETKINKKGKFQSKKRFGKSVANHAPAMLITILENKIKSLGGKFIKVDIKNAASRYDFTNNEFKEHGLNERKITLSNGNTHQRDLLAAFNLQHIDLTTEEYKKYNVNEMIKDYPIFCNLEKEEIQRFLDGLKTRHNSTIGI